MRVGVSLKKERTRGGTVCASVCVCARACTFKFQPPSLPTWTPPGNYLEAGVCACACVRACVRVCVRVLLQRSHRHDPRGHLRGTIWKLIRRLNQNICGSGALFGRAVDNSQIVSVGRTIWVTAHNGDSTREWCLTQRPAPTFR